MGTLCHGLSVPLCRSGFLYILFRAVGSLKHFLCDGDGFDIHKLADAVGREFAAVARLLDSAEGNAGIRSDHFVDEYHARLEFVNEAFTFAVVLGPGAGAESETAVIGDPDGFADVFDADQRRYRPEK